MTAQNEGNTYTKSVSFKESDFITPKKDSNGVNAAISQLEALQRYGGQDLKESALTELSNHMF